MDLVTAALASRGSSGAILGNGNVGRVRPAVDATGKDVGAAEVGYPPIGVLPLEIYVQTSTAEVRTVVGIG